MEHDDREYTDMLNDELKDIEPGAGLHDKVREGIARNVVRMRRRNTAFGAVAIAIIITMALSTAMPVFGRNGALVPSNRQAPLCRRQWRWCRPSATARCPRRTASLRW
jgi:hypothetical protein